MVSLQSLGMVEEDDALSAIDALILVEDWEGAAIVERAYSSRLELLGGDADYRLEWPRDISQGSRPAIRRF